MFDDLPAWWQLIAYGIGIIILINILFPMHGNIEDWVEQDMEKERKLKEKRK